MDGGEPGAGADLFKAYGYPDDLKPGCASGTQDVLTGNLQIYAGSAYE